MTRKLYHGAEPIPECMANVLACRSSEQGYEVLLDATVFYPEGGGQLSDVGTLDGAAVSYVYEDEAGGIWHRIDRAFSPGAKVRAVIDVPTRLDHTEQHTGEHILSGLALELFGAKNVGFHMAEDYVSIDLDLFLSQEQIEQLEDAANAAIARDIPVVMRVMSAGELDSVSLRKQVDGLGEEVRVVSMDGVDCCACCGTHCKSSALVRLIKITGVEKYKSGSRVFFLCGSRAMADYRRKHALVQRLAKRFSTGVSEVEDAVLRQGEELSDLKREFRARTARLMDYIARELLGNARAVKGVKLVCLMQQGWSQAERKQLADALCIDPGCLMLLFVPEGEQIAYTFARGDKVRLSMKDVCAAANAAFLGKGGGRDSFAQGSGTLKTGLEQAVEQFEGYVSALLR
ncbi:MAG: DHHA1 domain-containing protein [Bacillota bacterium]